MYKYKNVKHGLFYFVLRKSKEEYDKEMSRRLLLEEEVGSTSRGCSNKPMADSSEAHNTTSALRQQSSTAKVTHHQPQIRSVAKPNCASSNYVASLCGYVLRRRKWGCICKTCSITMLYVFDFYFLEFLILFAYSTEVHKLI